MVIKNEHQLSAIFTEFVIDTLNGITVFDGDDKVIFCNDTAAQMFGYAISSDLYGMNFNQIITHCYNTKAGLIIDTDDVENWLASANEKRRSKNHRRFEADFQDGSWYLISEQVVNNDYLVMISVDITDKKNAENRLTEMSKELYFLATTDALTNVYNRRHFIEQVNVEQQRCQREKYGYALLMLDIDLFKDVNDNFGHACGDNVLTRTATAIKLELREYDLLGRIGGEEFAILLPNTTSASALSIAQRIRTAIENLNIKCKNNTIKITASIGIAMDENANISVEDIFLKADKLLYKAKDKGRNQVAINQEK